MISNVVKLPSKHTSNISDVYGNNYAYRINPTDVIFLSNKIHWTRPNNMFKIIEKINDDNYFEHIVLIANNKIIPFITKNITSNSIKVYSQNYISAIRNLNDCIINSNISNSTLEQSALDLLTKRCYSLGDVYLGNYLSEYKYNASMIDSISSQNTLYVNNDLSVDGIQNLNTTIIPMKTDLQWIYLDINRYIIGLHETLSEDFDLVRRGSYDANLLKSTCDYVFRPWNSVLVNHDNTSIDTIANISSFINGDMDVSYLYKYNPISVTNRFVTDSLLNTSMAKDSVQIPEYTKELATLLEYIQFMNLTDFCIEFDLALCNLDLFFSTVKYVINRYFLNIDASAFVFPYVNTDPSDISYSFKCYLMDLETYVFDWIVTVDETFINRNYKLSLIKNFNEELLMVFTDSFGCIKEVFYYDLITSALCGRNVCKL